MGERKLLLMCHRPRGAHTLGEVYFRNGALHATVKVAERVTTDDDDRTGFRGVNIAGPLDDLVEHWAYCDACNKRYSLDATAIRRAFSRGRRTPVILTPRGRLTAGYWEKQARESSTQHNA